MAELFPVESLSLLFRCLKSAEFQSFPGVSHGLLALRASRLHSRASLVARTIKNLPAMWEILVQSLIREDPLEKGKIPTPVFLPGEFRGQRSLAGYSPWDQT